MDMKNFFVSSLIWICSIGCLWADVALPHVYSDHMVLKRHEAIVIYGFADPLEQITGTFKNEILKTSADDEGRWKLSFKASDAGGPFEMLLKGKNEIRLKDIYIGEVWFCSGQSNMEWSLKKAENGNEAIKSADFDQIRFLNVKKTMQGLPAEDISPANRWEVCTPESAADFSAVAYFFGRALHKKYGVPIGLIHSSWGGSNIEAWMKAETFYDDKKLKDFVEEIKTIDFEVLTKQYKADVKAYHAYLDSFDLGSQEKWFKTSTDFSTWKPVELPKKWSKAGLKQKFGVVWVTKTIELQPEDTVEDAVLSLGRIDHIDYTYINGVLAGSMDNKDENRLYKIDKSLLKAGKNRITVRVKNPQREGGFVGSPDDLFIKTPAQKIALNSEWQYRVATPNAKSPPDRVHPRSYPTTLYNGMVYPFFKYNIKGTLWYQGESNMGDADGYSKLFQEMILDWRKQWGKDFPFLFVQLPDYKTQDVVLPNFRAAQKLAMQLDKVGMATIIDIGDKYDIHPRNKKDVGKRLALVADAMVYAKKSYNYQLEIKKVNLKKNGIKICFNQKLILRSDVHDIPGFEVLYNDGTTTNLSAVLKNKKSILT